MKVLKILVGCEYSQIVTKAFRDKGHEAFSCDILPTEGVKEWHYQCDIFEAIQKDNWDIGIFHPPCDVLSYVGNAYLDINKYGQKAIDRHIAREDALKFFMALWNAPINKICIENPRGYPMKFIKPTQIIHPYYFGDADKKLTCLWLKNLPPLLHSKQDTLFETRTHAQEPAPTYTDKSGKKRYRTDAISGNSKDAKKERARFFPKIAQAMANTWG